MAELHNDGRGAKEAPTQGAEPLSVIVTAHDTQQSGTHLPAVNIDMVRHEESKNELTCPDTQTNASSALSDDSLPEHKAPSKAEDEQTAPLEEARSTKPEDNLHPMSQWRSVELQNHQLPMPGLHPIVGAVPMPPIPDHVPKVSESLVSGQRLDWIQALQHNASLLGPRGLYRAFLARRSPHPGSRIPDFVRAMAEYLGDTEDKLNTLQRSLQPDSVPPPGMLDLRNNQAGGTGGSMPVPADPLGNVVMETRFYHCEHGFDFGIQNTPATVRGSPDRNHYTSSNDPAYFIRALFQRKETGTSPAQTLESGEIPDPKDINLLSFMVSSRPLAVFFEKRLGLRPGTGVPVLKLGKPFRSVICNHSHLKKQLELLIVKYGSEGAGHGDLQEQPKDSQPLSQQVGPSADASSDDDKLEIFDQQSALEHFRLLVKFIDRYLGEKIALFEAFQDGQREKVQYEDLWMLFSNGEKIFCPLRENRIAISSSDSSTDSETDDDEHDDDHLTKRRYVPQAYRVMAAVGGAPLQSSFAPQTVDVSGTKLNDDPFLQLLFGRHSAFRAQTNAPGLQRAKERFSPLHVVCMYVDFDGAKYGMDTEIFTFKPFDGQIHIGSLEAYPLQYFVSPWSNYLVRRGQKFIDVTASPRYMDHAGMTIGETREECNSPVVVDLKLAFTEYQKDFPPDDSIIPKFKSLTKTWPLLERTIPDFFTREIRCSHTHYCYSSLCGSDRYLESQRLQLDQLQPRVRELLDEIESLPKEGGDVSHLKEYMKSQDLIELLPGSVPGFSLRNRAWVQLNLDQLSFIEPQDDWNKLALPKGHREIVQAMVQTHSMGSKGFGSDDSTDRLEMDLVRGKGKGCIILLHGVPGVGKTSTAECVASYTKRPLYSITCGDVGYEPEDVERKMGKHFKLAHRWGCVLLLDEADVFLAKRDVRLDEKHANESVGYTNYKRQKTNVKRNGLVSSFLRILEYYSGILFLTTNRVGAIDDAFRSRLHLTLYYPKLTQAQTLKIWRTNLQRLKENNKLRLEGSHVPIKFNDKKIITWVEKNWRKIQWNGRQIRNAFQTAVALAEFKARNSNAESKDDKPSKTSPRVTVDHFKLLARASTQFSEYLRETHGDDEDERAILDKLRARPVRKKVRKAVISDEDDEDDEDEDDEDEDDNYDNDGFSDNESGSESSGASASGESSDSATEGSAGGKKSKKKGKQKEGGRSHSSKKKTRR